MRRSDADPRSTVGYGLGLEPSVWASSTTTLPAGSAGWVASHFPKARVVKAFNTVYFKVLQAEAHRGGNDGVGIPLAGDDPDAIAAAVQLTRDAGFTPVIVGGLEKGKLFEPGTAVYASGMKGSEVSAALGVEAATGMREGKTT